MDKKQNQKYKALIGNTNASASDPRKRMISVRWTDREYNWLQLMAEASGCAMAEYVRGRVLRD